VNGNGGYQSRRCPECSAPVAFLEGCVACIDPGCGWNKCE
jgi:hypothetical protein